MSFDPRVTLARADLAAAGLEGIVRAPRFERAKPMRLVRPLSAIRTAPDASAEQADQVLFGERFDVLEMRKGWAWGQAARDGYVGHVEAVGLSPDRAAPTHWVSVLRAFAFEKPSFKAPTRGSYSLNALVRIEAEDGEFLRDTDAGWFHRRHLSPVGVTAQDFVAVAEGFVGAPYVWGGRDSAGVDCSGLIQQALFACGRACPRDTDLQQASLGAAIGPEDLRRGDLVFWRGHAGVMLDAQRLLHANTFHMATAAEPIAEAVARIASGPMGSPTAFRRLGL